MGFLSSLSEIHKNKNQFKEWEQNNSDKDKQRQILAQNNPPKPDEFSKSQAKGKVIMNVIDIMDTHSEDIAENTETAVMPFAALAPLATLFASGALALKFIIEPSHKKFDEALTAFYNTENGTALNKIYEILKNRKDELEKSNSLEINSDITKLKLGYFDSKNLFNKKNIDILSSSKDKELNSFAKTIIEAKEAYNKIPELKNDKKLTLMAVGSVALLTLATFIYSNIKAAKIQVQSSRVARWQSRRDLEDPKYFVQYNDAQIEEAKKQLESKKEDNKKGLFSFFKKDNNKFNKNSGILALKEVIKDNKNYQEWKKTYNQEDKKIKRQLTQKEIEEAKKDQEVIQRITKQINNKAEEYSENMETTGGIIIGSTPFLGAAIGAVISKIVSITGIGEKISKKNLEKLLINVSENQKTQITDSLEQLKKNNAGVATWLKSALENVKNFGSIIKDRVISSKSALKIFPILGDIKKAIMSTPMGRGVMITLAGSFITRIVGSLIGLKLQKNSARAGRYIAKREIERDSNNFIGYSDKDFETVKDIKAKPKTLGQKFVNYITFLPRVLKEYFEYEKYNKTQAKYNRELLDELTKTNVSDEQLKEAKNLQRKLFTTFENVDDKSQEYSESIEAVTEMAQPFIPYIGYLLFTLPFIAGGVKLYKSGAPKAVESITGFLAKHTNFLKGKTVQKYTNEVAQSVKGIVDSQKIYNENNPLYSLVASILKSDKNKELFNSIKGSDNELKALIEKLINTPELRNLSKTDLNKIINSLYSELGDIAKKEEITEYIKIFNELEFDKAGDLLDNLYKNYQNSIPNVKISEILNSKNILDKVSKNLGIENLPKISEEFIETQLKNGKVRELLTNAFNDEIIPPAMRPMVRKLLMSSLNDEQAAKIYKNILTIKNNLPKEEAQKIFNAMLNEFSENPEKFMKALKSGELLTSFATKGIVKAGALATGTWAAISIIFTFALESTFANIQKRAGRLGVMKAIEDLKDEKYYADDESLELTNNIKETFKKMDFESFAKKNR